MIDLDSRAVNVEGNQEGAVKGYHPGHKGNNCYHILMAFCDELKAYITGFMRSGNTYTSTVILLAVVLNSYNERR